MTVPSNAPPFHFELVSPERKLISEPARMVVIPAEEGDIGVLANHASLVATVRPGVVEVYSTDGQAPRRIFIAGGFADISAKNCTILAEEAVNVSDLNQAELEQSIRNLNEDMGLAGTDIERQRISRRLAAVQAKLDAVAGIGAAAH